MTVGELARRSGLTVKAIREYESLGLIYSAGRSEGNYRLYDESALWCAGVVRGLRSLGLRIDEIQALVSVYLERPDEPIGPRLSPLLDAAEHRIDEQIAELTRVHERIETYRRDHAAELAGEADPAADDPHRTVKRP